MKPGSSEWISVVRCIGDWGSHSRRRGRSRFGFDGTESWAGFDLLSDVPVEVKTSASAVGGDELVEARPDQVEQLVMYCALADRPVGRLLTLVTTDGAPGPVRAADVTIRDLAAVGTEMQARAAALRHAWVAARPAALPACRWFGRGCEFQDAGVCDCTVAPTGSGSAILEEVKEVRDRDDVATRVGDRLREVPAREESPSLERFRDLVYPRRTVLREDEPPGRGGVSPPGSPRAPRPLRAGYGGGRERPARRSHPTGVTVRGTGRGGRRIPRYAPPPPHVPRPGTCPRSDTARLSTAIRPRTRIPRGGDRESLGLSHTRPRAGPSGRRPDPGVPVRVHAPHDPRTPLARAPRSSRGRTARPGPLGITRVPGVDVRRLSLPIRVRLRGDRPAVPAVDDRSVGDQETHGIVQATGAHVRGGHPEPDPFVAERPQRP